MTTLAVEAAGRVVQVSSPDRVLFPRSGWTKADLLGYLQAVADVLLPHVVGRPLTLRRFPDGLGGRDFFQTRTPPHPDWVRTVTLHYPRTGKTFASAVVDDVAGLVWAANLSTVELHPFLAPADDLAAPHAMVLDLDPGPPAGLVDACRVALLARALLEERGLPSYPKSSGSKGMHVYVPVRETSYDETKRLARGLARTLAGQHPELVVDRQDRVLRSGRVLVDWGQNDAGKSTVAPYSLRAYDPPQVSTPVTWSEVEEAVRTRDARPLVATPGEVLRRVAEHGDLFAPVLG